MMSTASASASSSVRSVREAFYWNTGTELFDAARVASSTTVRELRGASLSSDEEIELPCGAEKPSASVAESNESAPFAFGD